MKYILKNTVVLVEGIEKKLPYNFAFESVSKTFIGGEGLEITSEDYKKIVEEFGKEIISEYTEPKEPEVILPEEEKDIFIPEEIKETKESSKKSK